MRKIEKYQDSVKYIVSESSRIDPKRLAGFLDDLNIEVKTDYLENWGSKVVVIQHVKKDQKESSDVQEFIVPKEGSNDLTWLAAGKIRRLCRTVLDFEQCNSPGIHQLIDSKEYSHPVQAVLREGPAAPLDAFPGDPAFREPSPAVDLPDDRDQGLVVHVKVVDRPDPHRFLRVDDQPPAPRGHVIPQHRLAPDPLSLAPRC